MLLPGFGDDLRDWFHATFRCRFQAVFDTRTNFSNLFTRQIVRVIQQIFTRQSSSDKFLRQMMCIFAEASCLFNEATLNFRVKCDSHI